MPTPYWFSEALLASPVPTQTDPSRGLVANAPIARRGRPLLIGRQWAPESEVRQTPPLAEPAYTYRPAEAKAVIRPVTYRQPTPKLPPRSSGSFRKGLSVTSCQRPPLFGRLLAALLAASSPAAGATSAGAAVID